MAHPGPWRRWNAALLNLSGVSAGYFYLGRVRTGLAALAGAAVLVWIAAAGAVERDPAAWLAVLALWPAWTALHAWVIGGPRADAEPDSAARPWTPALVGVLAVAALVAGVLALGGAARSAAAEGRAAHEDGDCWGANRHYDRVHEFFQLSFSDALGEARAERAACDLLNDARTAASLGVYEDTVTAYGAYLALDAPAAEGIARGELAAIHADQARAELSEADPTDLADLGRYSKALAIYALLATDFADTPEAEAAPAAVQAMYDDALAAATEAGACEPLDALGYFARAGWIVPESHGDAAAELTAAAVADALTRWPAMLFDCGRAAHDDGDDVEAEILLNLLLTEFPEDANAGEAQEILDAIDAERERIAEEEAQRAAEEEAERQREAEEAAEQAVLDGIRDDIADARGYGGDLAAPEDTGSSGSGEVLLEIGNSTNVQLEVLYTGPETGSFTVNGCSDCSSQCSDWVAVYETVSLPAGEYEVVVRTTGYSAYPYYGAWDLNSGNKYTSCYYLTG
ncbi:hypothetical protein [Glycomyces paridis]|uniref:Uncharacterized protein n=1 Tax=Glycomyces paridis TaxID=2126555 RepID=A0A4S8P929_9ACTN|nr:hypothetical protein [Glycomyces paridis]THV24359.1 hypothetical protein E9998_21270 [Glycomyces paridis]